MSRTRMTTHIFILSYLPLIVKAAMPSILNIVRNIFMLLYGSVEEVVTMCFVYKIWRLLCSYPPPLLCQNSLTRELKIRGLVLKKLLTHDKFQL